MRYGLLLFLLCPLIALADIYQWTDGKGIAHFSDVPQSGAKKISLEENSIITNAPSVPVADANEKVSSLVTNKTAGKSIENYYTNFSIAQPQNEATFFNKQGELVVTVAIKPGLKEADQVTVLVDGQFVRSTLNGVLVRIENIERGAHTVQLQIQNKTGKVLMTSSAITIFMRRPSVATVNHPNIQPLQLPKSTSLHNAS